ncbi:5-keto-4-deoxy-D-glucarate aldolase [bioreactor metagenome]|uniref:5-keto-4-deoxy-D-glucarate aldolase n=1 Tax=bioreactor metagenome TaxID=1076179 RepID=A0A644ZXF5_9ZZZZ
MTMKLKEKIEAGQLVTGCFVNVYAPVAVEMLGRFGFDFLLLDQEHGCFSPGEMEHMMRAADMVGLSTIVRVDYENSSVQKALDMGAAGVQIPMIRTAEDARKAVSRAKYPPWGSRGVDLYSRAYRLGGFKDCAEYLNYQNRDTLVIAQIETPEAAEYFEEIMGVPGIDLAFFGALDLSVNLGYLKGPGEEPVKEVLEGLYHRAEALSVPTGAVFLSGAIFAHAVSSGSRFLVTTLMGAMSAGFAQIMTPVIEYKTERNDKYD